MSDVRYTKDHEWIPLEGGVGVVGITDYAQNALGDVVFVEVPEAGKALTAGGEAGVIESVKAASDIYSPASGTVESVNDALTSDPALLNTEPYGRGWIFTLRLAAEADLSSLKPPAAYAQQLAGQ